MNSPPIRVVILISGRGSNMQAIIDQARGGQLPVTIEAVISNTPDAPGLARAREAGLRTHIIDDRDYPSRAAFEQALMEQIDRYAPHLLVLAGFMRILGKPLVNHYAGRMMNIHPSLLPAFPGLNTHARVLASGEKQHGASVHFVTPEVDGGPLIVQARVPVLDGDTEQVLAERVLEEEHRIYPLAVRWFAECRLQIKDGTVLLDGERRPEQGLSEQARTGTAQ